MGRAYFLIALLSKTTLDPEIQFQAQAGTDAEEQMETYFSNTKKQTGKHFTG